MKTPAGIGFLLAFLASPVIAAPNVEVRPSKERTSHSEFQEDHLDLVLKDGGKIVDAHYFYSSYGIAEATVVRNRKGTYFVILRHGEGRGPHVRLEYTLFSRF